MNMSTACKEVVPFILHACMQDMNGVCKISTRKVHGASKASEQL